MLTILTAKPMSNQGYEQHRLGMNLAAAPDGMIAGGCQPTSLLRAGSLLKGDLSSALLHVWLLHISSKF